MQPFVHMIQSDFMLETIQPGDHMLSGLRRRSESALTHSPGVREPSDFLEKQYAPCLFRDASGIIKKKREKRKRGWLLCSFFWFVAKVRFFSESVIFHE
jgi:prolipoprotein diacylglyceryltransferase